MSAFGLPNPAGAQTAVSQNNPQRILNRDPQNPFVILAYPPLGRPLSPLSLRNLHHYMVAYTFKTVGYTFLGGVLIIEVIGRGDIFQEVAAESEHLSLVFCSARTVGDPQDLEELCRAFEPNSLGLKVLFFFLAFWAKELSVKVSYTLKATNNYSKLASWAASLGLNGSR